MEARHIGSEHLIVGDVDFSIPSERDASGAPRWSSLKKVVFIASLLLAAILVLAATWTLVQSLLYPTTERGRCLVLQPYECIEVAATQIEESAHLQLPSGADIAESSSSRTLKSGATRALVRLPADSKIVLGESYQACDATVECVPVQDDEYLRSHALVAQGSMIDSNGAGSSSVVTYARDADGRSWALIRVIWNG
jgi:hypothetical protein